MKQDSRKPSEAIKIYSAFEGSRLIARGELSDVAVKVKETIDRGERGPVLIFDNHTSQVIELDFRGGVNDVVERLKSATNPGAEEAESSGRKPGRPKLGVVAREVTLLPRHWEWLNCQPGGASVALRKLVEDARRVNADRDRCRQAREATYRFLSVMAGNEPGFEEAARELFARNAEKFEALVADWPMDVRDHGLNLAAASFAETD